MSPKLKLLLLVAACTLLGIFLGLTRPDVVTVVGVL
jgi:hypothetical protein